MLTEFQKHKFTVVFNSLDLDNNGFLEEADVKAMLDKMCKNLSIPLGSPKHKQVREYWAWEKVKGFDLDGDGRVSLKEWLTVQDMTVSDENLMQYVLNGIGDLFHLCDVDGDGKVSSEEYAAYLQTYGVEKEAAQEAFKHLDHDGNGFLTVDELIKNAKEFYLSDDPEAPGNWYWGPLDW